MANESPQSLRPKREPNIAWRARFLAALAERPNVTRACKLARRDRRLAYLDRHADEEFAAQWDKALDVGVGSAEDEAWDRGLSDSDTLLIFMLKAHRPDKYRERLDLTHNGKLDLTTVITREVIGG